MKILQAKIAQKKLKKLQKEKADRWEELKDGLIADEVRFQQEKMEKLCKKAKISDVVMNMGITTDDTDEAFTENVALVELVKKKYIDGLNGYKKNYTKKVKAEGEEVKVYNKPDTRKGYTKKYFKDKLSFEMEIKKVVYRMTYRRATDDFVDSERNVFATITKASQYYSGLAGLKNYLAPWKSFKAVVGGVKYDIERLDINPVPEIAP